MGEVWQERAADPDGERGEGAGDLCPLDATSGLLGTNSWSIFGYDAGEAKFGLLGTVGSTARFSFGVFVVLERLGKIVQGACRLPPFESSTRRCRGEREREREREESTESPIGRRRRSAGVVCPAPASRSPSVSRFVRMSARRAASYSFCARSRRPLVS